MRIVVLLLLLANLTLFGYTRLDGAAGGEARASDRAGPARQDQAAHPAAGRGTRPGEGRRARRCLRRVGTVLRQPIARGRWPSWSRCSSAGCSSQRTVEIDSTLLGQRPDRSASRSPPTGASASSARRASTDMSRRRHGPRPVRGVARRFSAPSRPRTRASDALAAQGVPGGAGRAAASRRSRRRCSSCAIPRSPSVARLKDLQLQYPGSDIRFGACPATTLIRAADSTRRRRLARARCSRNTRRRSTSISASRDFAQELATLPGAYAPPRGRLLLAGTPDAALGCVALRPLPRGDRRRGRSARSSGSTSGRRRAAAAWARALARAVIARSARDRLPRAQARHAGSDDRGAGALRGAGLSRMRAVLPQPAGGTVYMASRWRDRSPLRARQARRDSGCRRGCANHSVVSLRVIFGLLQRDLRHHGARQRLAPARVGQREHAHVERVCARTPIAVPCSRSRRISPSLMSMRRRQRARGELGARRARASARRRRSARRSPSSTSGNAGRRAQRVSGRRRCGSRSGRR